MSGYLVVLTRRADIPGNYCGVDRMPPYPTDIRDEVQAMEEYVFGDYKDGSDSIPSRDAAEELLEKFAASPREFEIIYYDKGHGAVEPPPDASFLGFDVACPDGDRWSIVAEYRGNPLIAHYKDKLNENGLLSRLGDAEEYLQEYRALQLPDHHLGLTVLRVFQIPRRAS